MTFYVWFDAANFGAVPALVGADRVVSAQSAIWSTVTFLGIAAPSLGGVLAATIGPANAIAVDAASFAVSALLIASIRRRFRMDELGPADSGVLGRTVRDIKDGLSFLWHQKVVRALTLLGFGVSFSGGAVSAVLVVYGVEELGLDVDGRAIGVLFSAGAVGSFLGSLALPRLARRFPPGLITIVTLALDTALLLAFAVAPAFGAALPLYAAWSAAQMTIILNGITLRQRVTPDRLQGRVNTTARMIAWGGTPFGATVGGVIAEVVDVRTALVLVATGVGASAVLAWFTPLRERFPVESLAGRAA
jgi:hypothetical protein